MSRFISSMGVGFLAIIVLGSGVLLQAASDDDGNGEAVVLGQVEDGDETLEGEQDPTLGALTPIEQFIRQFTSAAEGTDLPTAQRVLLSRDPFEPVVPADDPPVDGTNGGTDGDGTDDGGTDDGDGASPDEGDACTGSDEEQVCEGVVVTLTGFTDDGQAIVTVDGTSFTVDKGDEFATSFRVLAINDPCVTLLYGDETFSVCAGATVLK